MKPQKSAKLARKLNIGCGYDKREGYVNVDVDPACEPDILVSLADDSGIPRQHFDEVLAHDVLEHIPRSATLSALLTWADYLKPGGKLVIQTSNVEGVIDMMRANPKFDHQFGMTICMFGNQAHPGDFHYTGFTPLTLRVYLLSAGFVVESMETIDGWLLAAVCSKQDDWTCDVAADDVVAAGFQRAFGRDPDPHNWAALEGVPPKEALHAIWSSPERLFVTARRHGL
ncbi:class I SAM-dependent methyltransferase [Brevundimonas sp.]|uniref:class I SAM-dependent methyltransferase n=1 Tax=Brevundimonas sp. TaxID=1871086 RepID=UPI003D0A9C5E